MSTRISAHLKKDQDKVLHPDVDSAFVDESDVINRLLPYHLFQQPKEDLNFIISGKGKGKAASVDWDDAVAVSKLSLECLKRREALRERWRKLKIRSGQRSAPDSQAYYLAQVVLDADRSENAWLSNELRTARAEVERLEREKRAASNTANMARMSHFSVAPQPVMTSTAPTQYYRGYPYAYTQAYGTIAPSPAPTVSTFPVSSTPAAAPPTTASTNYAPYQSSGAIPVQLPVASLPALHALGITPIPAGSLPAEGQPQPAAVLRGSTANGAILSLEINVSLLQSTQMSGLAMILNSLVTRSNAASAGATATGSPVPSTSTMSNNNVPNPSTT
ncbi:hypothetical protein CPC08DRAFT_657326 [Agrocybe pediades]|nr:hypothetical protein CPC08DRAFT_657326 [Agrocybe pediades]